MLPKVRHLPRPFLAWLLVIAASAGSLLPTGLAQDSISVPTVGSSIGLRSFAPGRWGVARVTISNQSEQPATIRALVNLKSSPDLRFGRDVWVPGRGTRTTSIPMHIPSDPEQVDRVEIIGRIVNEAGVLETIGNSQLGVLVAEDATALIQDATFEEPEEEVLGEKDPAYEVVLAMRVSRGLRRAVITPSDRLLPATVQGWDPVRHIVIASNRLATETGAATALRQWVAEGGRMWVQLNRSDVETLRALFGSTLGLSLIDRVPLTTFEMVDARAEVPLAVAKFDVEEPIELIRATVDNGEVLYEVDGWPVAVEFRYGRGLVLVTLLDAHGWMRPRGQSDPAYQDPQLYTDFMPLEALEDLSNRIYLPSEELVMDRDVVAAYVSDRIGYRIPGRNGVLAVLAAFCLSILVGGLWLAARKQLEYLAAVAVLAGLVAAAVLIGLGLSRRGEVPPTMAELRVVSVAPQTGQYTAQGSVAVYQPEQMEADFSARGLRIDPQMADLGGQIREWIWTDGDRWQWNGTRLPPGVRVMRGDSAGMLQGPASAQATFGPAGLEGQLNVAGFLATPGADLPAVRVSDALLLFPHAAPLAANLQPDGRFRAGEQDRLVEGQFTNATLVDDEQRRRALVLEPWFATQRDVANASGPVVLVWLDHDRPTLSSEREIERIGTELMAIPLTLARTPAEAQIAIPSAAIRARSIRGSMGQSAAYDNQREGWTFPNARSTVTRLRFQLPPAALPIRLDSLKLVLDCHLPSRPLEVFIVRGEEVNSVGTLSSPSGVVEFSVTDAAWLGTDAEGGVIFEIAVGDLTSEVSEATISNSGWSIRSSRLEASGKTLPVREEGVR